MFQLIKKDKEKELGKKDKKDKKDKKERMSQSELKSLEEISIRRGFFHVNRGSTKRQSKSKLEISNPIPIKVASNTDLCLTNVETDPIPNNQESDVKQTSPTASGENLISNELEPQRCSVKERAAKFGELAKINSAVGQRQAVISQKSKDSSTPILSEQSRTTLNSTSYLNPKGSLKVQIPEVVEKTFPGADLQLPLLVTPPVPDARELEIQRRNTGDFGFSLRRTTMIERQQDGGVCRRVVHFAEPGAGTKDWVLGLVPGDKLVEINGINVESKNRDEIVEMIRQSGEAVRLKVQPILELSELNRSWLRTSQALPKDTFDVSTIFTPTFLDYNSVLGLVVIAKWKN